MLVQSPGDFVTATLVAERLGGAMGEAPCGAAAGHQGPTPMELVQAQGQGHAVYTFTAVLQVRMVDVAVVWWLWVTHLPLLPPARPLHAQLSKAEA